MGEPPACRKLAGPRAARAPGQQDFPGTGGRPASPSSPLLLAHAGWRAPRAPESTPDATVDSLVAPGRGLPQGGFLCPRVLEGRCRPGPPRRVVGHQRRRRFRAGQPPSRWSPAPRGSPNEGFGQERPLQGSATLARPGGAWGTVGGSRARETGALRRAGGDSGRHFYSTARSTALSRAQKSSSPLSPLYPRCGSPVCLGTRLTWPARRRSPLPPPAEKTWGQVAGGRGGCVAGSSRVLGFTGAAHSWASALGVPRGLVRRRRLGAGCPRPRRQRRLQRREAGEQDRGPPRRLSRPAGPGPVQHSFHGPEFVGVGGWGGCTGPETGRPTKERAQAPAG